MERRWMDAGLRIERIDGKATRVGGYAAKFDSESVDLGGFVERIAQGAFSGSMDKDIRALWNHDTNHVLGRRSAGTLRLVEDTVGLAFELDLPDTQAGRDVAVSIERRDVTGMSFGFAVRKDQWAKIGDKRWLRTLLDVDLMEISPTGFPAYQSTEVGMRSTDVADCAAAFARAQAEHESRQRRLHLLELSVR
jgi:HK97 family phage prohead protease